MTLMMKDSQEEGRKGGEGRRGNEPSHKQPKSSVSSLVRVVLSFSPMQSTTREFEDPKNELFSFVKSRHDCYNDSTEN